MPVPNSIFRCFPILLPLSSRKNNPPCEISVPDIISTLPDVLLCHILSFLQTKHAVATSVLSKRWKHLWRYVLALDFPCNTSLTVKKANFRFIEFVYSVLLSREADHPIKSFRLQILYDCPDHVSLGLPNIMEWVNFVVQRRLEYLHLHIVTMDDLPKLPLSILSCRTLVVLKLYCFNAEGISSVVLPSLKSLYFYYMLFPTVRDFMLFLAGCPILEDLHASRIEFESEDSLTCREWKSFSLCKLIGASIVCSYFHFPLKELHNVDSLHIEIDKVYRPNDVIPTFHNLTSLELMALNYKWCLLVEVLNHCPKLQKLDLNQVDIYKKTWTRKENGNIWVDPEFVPECLSLHLRTCNLRNFLGLHGELMLARYILQNARVLQTMGIWNRGQIDMKRLLSSSPRASASCKLTVYYGRLCK